MDFLKNINIGFKLKDGNKINENLNQFFVQNKSRVFHKHPLFGLHGRFVRHLSLFPAAAVQNSAGRKAPAKHAVFRLFPCKNL